MTKQVAEVTLRRWLVKVGWSQSDLACAMDVSRTTVSKWCSGALQPSESRAREIEKVSLGEVPATIWPRRTFAEGTTRGAQAIWAAAREQGLSILGLAKKKRIPQRSLARWAAGEYRPRLSALKVLNRKLGTSLTISDFGGAPV